MPNYAPCRTGDDEDAHLYASVEPDRALCGKRRGNPATPVGDLPVCPACGKRLMARIFDEGGPQGFTSVEVTVHS